MFRTDLETIAMTAPLPVWGQMSKHLFHIEGLLPHPHHDNPMYHHTSQLKYLSMVCTFDNVIHPSFELLKWKSSILKDFFLIIIKIFGQAYFKRNVLY